MGNWIIDNWGFIAAIGSLVITVAATGWQTLLNKEEIKNIKKEHKEEVSNIKKESAKETDVNQKFTNLEDHLHEHISRLETEIKDQKIEQLKFVDKIFERIDKMTEQINKRFDKLDDRFFGLVKLKNGGKLDE